MSGCTYDYNWKDLLTSYDGSVITYDEIGNPLTYRDSMTMSWEGRRLSSINNGAINYEYDSSGIRSKKTVDGNTTVFYNIGGVKAGEYRDNGIDILYLYDDKGKIYGISVNEQIYYFMENIQGDVIGLYDYYGKVCARYTYDPWGNIIGVQELDTVTFGEDNKKIGEVNPFRYRGYYYDAETGFYYLNSRYYDPQVKRFINADAYASTGQGFNGTNMFCYCLNNSVNNADYMGNKTINIYGYSVDSQKWGQATIKYGSIGARNRLLNNPQEFIGSAPSELIGAARPYVNMPGSTDPNSPNCYAYAIGSPVNEQPGGTSGRIPSNYSDVYDVGKSVEADLIAKGKTVRVIDGPNSLVYQNEYKIALRVGTSPIGYNKEDGTYIYDYHFMRQTNTGQWAEKHGIAGPSILWNSGMTPDTIPWTLGGIPYYDSPIIYYAVGE